jgi:putative chitinase
MRKLMTFIRRLRNGTCKKSLKTEPNIEPEIIIEPVKEEEVMPEPVKPEPVVEVQQPERKRPYITEHELGLVYPTARLGAINKFLPYLNKYMEQYEVNTPQRIRMFLAQIGHESGCLRYVEELASGRAYEYRADLGNTEMGDGVRFKGRGLIQITGRYNYQMISRDFGVDFIHYPELLSEPSYAVRSAFWFWDKKKLNEVCDTGDFRRLTRLINGGYNGMAHREEIYDLCKRYIV